VARTAETAEKYVHKGDKLYVEGKIRTRSYDDQNGVKRYTTEIFVDVMELLSAKPAAQPAPQQQVKPAEGNAAATAASSSSSDDLPF
jgi:single-strand DNA-binding protein